MKVYCNMHGNYCNDIFAIDDQWELDQCIHPLLLPLYKDNRVPDYVKSGWTKLSDDLWCDNNMVPWPNGIPSGPTPSDPNYTGPWPIPEEQEPEVPEEQSE